jgi:hypothetical protein
MWVNGFRFAGAGATLRSHKGKGTNMATKASPKPIEVGQMVKNTLSGITGYVALRSESISGYIWLYVQPIAKKDATEEPKLVAGDECEWELVAGLSAQRPANPRQPAQRFELGQRVKDKVTGFTGIACDRIEHLNRCWSYDVQSETIDKKDNGKTGALESFQSNRLVLVNDGIYKAPQPEKRVEPRATGPCEYTPQKGY